MSNHLKADGHNTTSDITNILDLVFESFGYQLYSFRSALKGRSTKLFTKVLALASMALSQRLLPRSEAYLEFLSPVGAVSLRKLRRERFVTVDGAILGMLVKFSNALGVVSTLAL